MKNKIIKYFIFILAFNILSITCSEIVYAKTMNRSEMQEYIAREKNTKKRKVNLS